MRIRKEIVIHIGYPKTGTTTLQKHFFPKLETHEYLGKDDLSQRDTGFSYLIKKRVFDNINMIKSYESLSELIYKKIKSKALISDEDFIFNCLRPNLDSSDIQFISTNEVARRLKQIFTEDKFKVKILIVIRRQDELILSLYAQSYRHFYSKLVSTDTFEKFYALFLQNENNSLNYVLEYDKIYKEYKELFGNSEIEVMPYEQLLISPDIFYENICNLLNIDTDNLNLEILSKFENVRRHGLIKKTRKYTLLDIFKSSPIVKININPIVKRQVKNCLRALVLPSKSVDKTIILSQEQRIAIMNRYNESNIKIDEEFSLNLKSYGYYL
jgi:hypothetical protein